MKTICITIFLIFGLSLILSAQTKLVAHKSHGGTNANFAKALESDLFTDIMLSDFGEPVPPTRKELVYTLDSLIYLEDSTFVLISSTRNIHFDWLSEEKLSEHRYDIQKKTILIPELIKNPALKDSISHFLQEPQWTNFILDSLQLINFENIKYETRTRTFLKRPAKKEQRKLRKQMRKEKKKMEKDLNEKKQSEEEDSSIKVLSAENNSPSRPGSSLIPPRFIFLLMVLGLTLSTTMLFRKWTRAVPKS